MSTQKINPRVSVLVLFIILAAVFRLLNTGSTLSPLANFTPIGAMALFGGTYFNTRWKGFFFPLLTLFISDVIMMKVIYPGHGNGLLYNGWYWTYGAFAVMVLIGHFIKKVSFTSVVIAAVSSALAHWMITDFGVWLGGGLDIITGRPYTRDLQGFIQCYVLAIPFMKNMLVGNLLYGGVLFGGFEYLQKRYPVLQLRTA
ncbi:MAG: hypothetical protein IM581_00705 [Chitinophagaceae bacterium]|nr:hypothetical protein [Chitinophagaceae bacterium]